MSMSCRTCITLGTYAHWNSYRIVRELIEPIAHPISLFCLFLPRTICRSGDLDGGDDMPLIWSFLYVVYVYRSYHVLMKRCLFKFNALKFQKYSILLRRAGKVCNPLLLVATLSQVIHDFDTFWLVPAYSSCFTLFVHAIHVIVMLWTLWSDYPVLWVCLLSIWTMLWMYFIFILSCLLVLACAWVYAHKPLDLT